MTWVDVRGWVYRALALAAAAVTVVFVTLWASTPDARPSAPVSQQWIEAISQFGIEAAYPPQEDLAVGDVFAFISGDAKRDVSSDPLPLRALKLFHIDLTEELKDAYRAIYRFPSTTDRPARGQVWRHAAATGAIFEKPEHRKELPLVLLPNFTVAIVKSANLGSGGLSGVATRLGLRSGSSSMMSVKVEGAETYGVPALPAEWKLADFCAAPDTRPVCTDSGLRKQLSMLVGQEIYEEMPPGSDGARRPRFSVELGLVNRVFLIRSIETIVERRGGFAAKIGDDDSSSSENGTGAQAAAPKADPDAPPPAIPAGWATAEERALAAAALPLTGNRPGISTTVQRGDASSVSIIETLERPVAIGFRTIRWKVAR
ncbi:hypothetical protein [Bosea sp. 124]|uniref:hypothetical protein n=1 Tax=Bosea sp. 124 TaxID=2135642 RepID=UPI000D338D23|nr:hypothetical protein [Bosea sp. 124]PTM39361.1 hypothetical protein C8D03_0850 [Bosea sp. 124]